jgi:hypothetical protein
MLELELQNITARVELKRQTRANLFGRTADNNHVYRVLSIAMERHIKVSRRRLKGILVQIKINTSFAQHW